MLSASGLWPFLSNVTTSSMICYSKICVLILLFTRGKIRPSLQWSGTKNMLWTIKSSDHWRFLNANLLHGMTLINHLWHRLIRKADLEYRICCLKAGVADLSTAQSSQSQYWVEFEVYQLRSATLAARQRISVLGICLIYHAV